MVSFPNCKINIGLYITGKREDGYHDLQTVFYPIEIKDALEIITSGSHENHYSFSGIPIDGNIEDNLCIKAYQLLKKDFPDLPAIKMHLHKAIPLGAGLGGGSADAAFILQLLNKTHSLKLSLAQFKNYALKVGSDCPFFLVNKPCIATGRGEILEEIPLDLSAYKILLVNPGIHINTARAFAALPGFSSHFDLEDFITSPINEWQKYIVNDFEKVVFASHPEIEFLKEILYKAGALYASMSGSGSSVYGLFENENEITLNFPAHYFYKWV